MYVCNFFHCSQCKVVLQLFQCTGTMWCWLVDTQHYNTLLPQGCASDSDCGMATVLSCHNETGCTLKRRSWGSWAYATAALMLRNSRVWITALIILNLQIHNVKSCIKSKQIANKITWTCFAFNSRQKRDSNEHTSPQPGSNGVIH